MSTIDTQQLNAEPDAGAGWTTYHTSYWKKHIWNLFWGNGTENTRVAYQVDTNHFSGIGIIPPPLGWYCRYSSVGIAVLSMVGISVGITVFA